MGGSTDENGDAIPRRKWWVLGLVLAALNYAFLFVLLVLLQIDQRLALLVALVGSVAGGVAVMVFVRYIY